MHQTLLSILLLCTATACYTYQPLPSPEPDVGTRVSVQLTDAGSRVLWNQIGPNVLHVEGDVMKADSTALRLSVRQVENIGGVPTNWNGEGVAVPREVIAGMQQRRFSMGGTVLMGGIAAAALYALYSVIGGGGSLEGNPGTGNPTPQQ